MMGIRGWCGRNRVTERRKHRETRRMRWDGGGNSCYEKEVVRHVTMSDDLAWGYWQGVTGRCVGSWDEIRIVYRSLRYGSWVADKLCIKRVLLARDGFHIFSLYSFSCIAKEITTFKQLRIVCNLDFRDINFERPLSYFRYHISVTNITFTWHCPLH
jgi:hypothetical protein